MEIIVENHKIETKEITDIEEAGHRMHGFIIHLIGCKSVHITKPQHYYMSDYDCAQINDRYRKLRESVRSKWEEDKIIINPLT